MTLPLDERQRAILAELGLREFAMAPLAADAPESVMAESASARPARPTAPALAPAVPAPAPVPVAARAVGAPTTPQTPPVPATGVALMDWTQLAQAVAECRACGLCASRHNTVFGVGDLQPDWMIVGEAPGEQEDLQGEPFVGQAGKLLDNMLRAIGVDRTRKVYIANVLKCRPPGNRNPEPAEVAQCEPFLRRQVELLQPKIIVAMGRFAVQSLLGSADPIGRLRGRVHDYRGVPVVVTYHPAYLLRNLPEKAKAWADLCLALERLRAQAG
jgi:uracil-DNA glycosylase